MSKADLIALAGARAVAVCGGPSIKVMVGRQDATAADPTGRMASEKAGVEPLKANFADKGFGVKELVVLSGAHTLGELVTVTVTVIGSAKLSNPQESQRLMGVGCCISAFSNPYMTCSL